MLYNKSWNWNRSYCWNGTSTYNGKVYSNCKINSKTIEEGSNCTGRDVLADGELNSLFWNSDNGFVIYGCAHMTTIQ